MKYKILFIAVLFLLYSCEEPGSYRVYQGEAQGTTFSIKYKDLNDEYEHEFDSILSLIDMEFSTYEEDSRISNFNRSFSGVQSSVLFKNLWENCWELNIESDGYFDPTLAPVLKLYDFDNSQGITVDSADVYGALSSTGMHLIKVSNDSIVKEKAAVKLDFNGVAQGYSVDLIARLLESKQVNDYMVEIGGEVRAKGHNPSNETWTIGIDRPKESGSRELIAKVKLDGISVATSGNYRKFKMVNGKKMGHIVNPKTGFMRETNIISVSVFSTECYRSDAMATAFMNMDMEEILNVESHSDDLGVLVIYTQGLDTLNYISERYKSIL